MEKYLQLLLFGWITAFIFMSVLWFIGKTIKNYAIVDVGWGLSITLIALTYSFLGDGFYSHKILITTIVMLWGLRLSLFLYFTRIAKGKVYEDYQKRTNAFFPWFNKK